MAGSWRGTWATGSGNEGSGSGNEGKFHGFMEWFLGGSWHETQASEPPD
jgi:hypothetical protein